MSNNHFVITGLDELRAALQTLPSDLAGEASEIVDNAAELAKSEIFQAYPLRTGDLRTHLTVEPLAAGPFGAGYLVKNTSKLAWIFENGSQARHTAIGANRGAMPPGHAFIPACVRQRQAMYEQLKDLLVRNGLLVSGEA